ncbi:unnamed protein product [Lepeophtheirus salmonis]|uniref:(salmon louse) hypothetical protein n=1 Tax=Lepeophtheirus salmonis TaxID=72036 RepID=A0A7R8CV57_LEPSM|nr:unnamed protein product [Lepeophtheirus salmonis]CAF2905520.1 unnamed protein product [Lepeophtheirus salmonis]
MRYETELYDMNETLLLPRHSKRASSLLFFFHQFDDANSEGILTYVIYLVIKVIVQQVKTHKAFKQARIESDIGFDISKGGLTRASLLILFIVTISTPTVSSPHFIKLMNMKTPNVALHSLLFRLLILIYHFTNWLGVLRTFGRSSIEDEL